MNQAAAYRQVTFRYLLEFRQWLDDNPDVDIVDIETAGQWERMRYVIKYRLKGNA